MLLIKTIITSARSDSFWGGMVYDLYKLCTNDLKNYSICTIPKHLQINIFPNCCYAAVSR
jgi:hypothetical protein